MCTLYVVLTVTGLPVPPNSPSPVLNSLITSFFSVTRSVASDKVDGMSLISSFAASRNPPDSMAAVTSAPEAYSITRLSVDSVKNAV